MIILISLIVISAFAKALMDTSADGKLKWSPYSYWLKEFSWVRKWKTGTTNVEAFPGSSTIFVFLTDGWHLAQFFFLNSAFACFLFYVVWWKVLIARAVFGVVFELSYRGISK